MSHLNLLPHSLVVFRFQMTGPPSRFFFPMSPLTSKEVIIAAVAKALCGNSPFMTSTTNLLAFWGFNDEGSLFLHCPVDLDATHDLVTEINRLKEKQARADREAMDAEIADEPQAFMIDDLTPEALDSRLDDMLDSPSYD